MDEVAANPPAISVRRMREEEQKAVKSLAGRTFPPLGGVFFSPSHYTLVAERDERMVGAVVPKLFVLPDKHRCGAMFWLMTSPEAAP